MKIKLSRWLWGVIPLAILIYAAVVGQRAAIEQKLLLRVTERLAKNQFDWPQLRVEGRDVIISGRADDEERRKTALALVRGVPGVRVAIDRAGLLDLVTPYSWSARLDDGRVKMWGHAPSKRTRKRIVGMARAAFPSAKLQDKLAMGRGAGDAGPFLAGVGFALQQLRRMKKGHVNLTRGDGNWTLTFSGVAEDFDKHRAALRDLKAKRPRSLALGRIEILAPKVNPFTFSARLVDNTLILRGYVPDPATKGAIVKVVRKSKPGLRVRQQLEIARGAPPGWSSFVAGILKEFARLDRGKFKMEGTKVRLSGFAIREELTEDIAAKVHAIPNKPFKLDLALRFRDRKIPVIDPYRWSASLAGGVLTFQGFTTDEGARKELAEDARREFKDVKIADKMRIARGLPGASKAFKAVGSTSVRVLAHMKSGTIKLTGQSLLIEGIVDREEAEERIKLILRSLPKGFAATPRIVLRLPTVSPYTWRAHLAENSLRLSGHAPGKALRKSLSEHAAQLLPSVEVVDRSRLAAGALGGKAAWSLVTRKALDALARLGKGVVDIRDGDVAIRGEVKSEEESGAVLSLLREGLPAGYRLRDQIKVTLPLVAPYRWHAAWEKKGITLGGFAPSKAARRALLEFARMTSKGTEIYDEMKLARGATGGIEVWKQAVEAALRGVTALGPGSRADLTGGQIMLRGTSKDPKARGRIAAILLGVPKTYRATSEVTFVRPPEPDLKWQAVLSGESLTLQGQVPGQKVRARLLEAARAIAAGRGRTLGVVDQMAVGPGVGDRWARAALAGLRMLARLREGQVSLDGTALRLEGKPRRGAVSLATIKEILAVGLPAGYRAKTSISNAKPRESEAERFTAIEESIFAWEKARARMEAERKAAEARARMEAERKAAEARARMEAERKAAEKRARMEAERKAAEARARMEAERKAAEARARMEAERKAAEARARMEAERKAAEARARMEAERKAAEARARKEEKLRIAAAAKAGREARRAAKARLAMLARKRASAKAAEADPMLIAALSSAGKVAKNDCQLMLKAVARDGRILFDRGKAELKPESFPTLLRLTFVAKRCKSAKIAIAGHTDSTGSAAYNLKLSDRRARAVASRLVEGGIGAARLIAKGYGETQPIVPNDTPEHMQMNRRIEFVVRPE